jgi:hypothetical protein
VRKYLGQGSTQGIVAIGDKDLGDPLRSPDMLLEVVDRPYVAFTILASQETKGNEKRLI